MRLRNRVLAIVAVIVVTFSALLLVTVSVALQADYAVLEQEQQSQDMDHGLTALGTTLISLQAAAVDYSEWDDTYQFAISPSQTYIDSNLANTTFKGFGIKGIIIANFTAVLYAGEYDPASEQVTSPPPTLVASFIAAIHDMGVPADGATGMAWVSGERCEMSCMPILATNGSGPSRGWLIMWNWIDAEMESRLSQATGYPVTFVLTDGRLTQQQLAQAENGTMVALDVSGTSAVLVMGLQDLAGQPFSLYEISVDRNWYQQGQAAVGLLWQSVLLLGVVLLAMFLVLMQIFVVRRVEDLDKQVEGAQTITGDARMKVSGDDEIAHLATSINGMLTSIEASYRQVGDEKKRYHNMIETQQEAIARLDQDLRIIIHNQAFVKLAVRPDVEGREFFASLGLEGGDIPRVLKELQEGGPALCAEFRLVREGEKRIQRWTFSALLAGSGREYQALGEDVTVMRQEEAELAEYRERLENMVEDRTRELYLVNAALQEEIIQRAAAEGRYRGVVEDQTELVFRFRPNGGITFSNGAYRRFNGNEEWLRLDEKGEEELVGAVRALAQGMDIAHARVAAISGGEKRELSITLRAIRSEAEMTEVQAVARDVTEASMLEREKTRALQMEWLGIISAALAHEINNLMMTALGKIRMAERSKDLRETQTLLREAEQSVIRSGRTTRRLLAFSKGGEPLRERVSVADLLEMAAESAEGEGARLMVEALPGFVSVDKAQMSEALAAIINDGLEASAPDGIVTVRARRDGNVIEIQIRDEGKGMPPEVLAKAFEPFFTTHEGRVGLGLPTAALIVEKHGGTIEASSDVGRGTEFRVRLSEDIPPKEERAPEVQRPARVLLMDDDEAILEVVTSLMADEGFVMGTALEGVAALEMYRKAMETEPYDVVVMDLLVHRGMGGKDAIKKLLEIDPRAKAIVASGYSEDPVMANYASYGFSAALYKPYRIEDLISAIKRLTQPSGPS
jgi:signal transduction histidine kinase/sensor domain CHASE-containing protein/ActR/RegA family two-component response regulator